MSALLNLQPPQPRFQHVTSEEYSAFTRQRPTIRSGNNLLKAYRRFVHHYPDLDQWFEAPLAERIGQTNRGLVKPTSQLSLDRICITSRE